ncbi:MAG: aspartate--tRNA ligase [Rickettsiales bacterium]|nr:aspartate--tRNA ligase [Rickettsiales bacterium]
MNIEYRTHTCGQLRDSDVNKKVKLSGWINSKRDHGGLLFIDLRDQYGLTQIVVDERSNIFKDLETIRLESVITIEGEVLKRSDDTANSKIATGNIEVLVDKVKVLSTSDILPIQVTGNENYGDEIRLKNRFLDLRRDKLKKNIILRSQIIDFIRRKMIGLNFIEFQTPILTASSPEGARDYLVASRIHPKKFYALPQAPQQFKQLIMVSGFDKYFQIAPCFRDEDARADRSPGEFYQLDIEMAFCSQEDIFNIVETVIYETFKKFSNKKITDMPFPKIPYIEAIEKYGTDKPDLRNPLIIEDVTDFFSNDKVEFKIFKNLIEKGFIVKAILAPVGKEKPRSFYDKLNNWSREQGASGLGYIYFEEKNNILIGTGPIAKNIDDSMIQELISSLKAKEGDAVFFVCDKKNDAQKFCGLVRTKLGDELSLIKRDEFKFCWIVDFPMYEKDQVTNEIKFSHNPFSMPQGGMKSLQEKNPLDIKALQYDIVCNGIELSSGAIRNHSLEIMIKAFEIAGYQKDSIEKQFPSLFNAFRFGPPPHGGIAPGIDRIVMLIAEEPNIREVIMFPLNQKAEDLLMGAPNEVSKDQLEELNLQLKEIEEN